MKRPPAQFSVRALLLMLTVLCVALGAQMRRVNHQRCVLAALNRLHGVVAFVDRPLLGLPPAKVLVPPRVRSYLGAEHFRSIVEVNMSFDPYVIGAKPQLGAQDADLVLASSIGDLRRLVLNGTAITDSGLRCLRGLRSIEAIELANVITPRKLEAGMLLRRLAVFNDPMPNTPQARATRNRLQRFSDSTAVMLVGYEYGAVAKYDPDVFRPSAFVESDTMWRFAGPLITDDGLRHLAPLNSLLKLSLDGTCITDAGMKWLTPLDSLEYLSLAETGIGNDGLAVLCGLPNLKTLDLSGTKVNDFGLPILAQLGPAVTVHLRDTAVTQAALDRVQGKGASVPKIILEHLIDP